MGSGVILSTGDIDDAVGPNSDENTSTGYGGAGDTDLSALSGFSTEDAVVLEFEFEVQGDELEFDFVFLCLRSTYEHMSIQPRVPITMYFAFYISGPGIAGQENLAVVPGTTAPVSSTVHQYQLLFGSFMSIMITTLMRLRPVNIQSLMALRFTLMRARKTRS